VCPGPENCVQHFVLNPIAPPECSPGENDEVVLIHSIPLAEALSCSPVTWEGSRHYVPYDPIQADGGLSPCRADSPIPQKLPVIGARDSSPTEVFHPFRVITGLTHNGGAPRQHEYNQKRVRHDSSPAGHNSAARGPSVLVRRTPGRETSPAWGPPRRGRFPHPAACECLFHGAAALPVPPDERVAEFLPNSDAPLPLARRPGQETVPAAASRRRVRSSRGDIESVCASRSGWPGRDHQHRAQAKLSPGNPTRRYDRVDEAALCALIASTVGYRHVRSAGSPIAGAGHCRRPKMSRNIPRTLVGLMRHRACGKSPRAGAAALPMPYLCQ
jgi:hypothetical protein